MKTNAVVLTEPQHLSIRELDLSAPTDQDVLVGIEWSGISTGTERLLWSGQMPHFPGMGYPLVPGYESVGRVASRIPEQPRAEAPGDRVFVPGATLLRRYSRPVRRRGRTRLVVPASRLILAIGREQLGEQGVSAGAWLPPRIMPLRKTATRSPISSSAMACLADFWLVWPSSPMAARPPPSGRSTPPACRGRREGYQVRPSRRRTTRREISLPSATSAATAALLDTADAAASPPGGEIVLAGFYTDRISFAFAPAFMREARLRIAAQFIAVATFSKRSATLVASRPSSLWTGSSPIAATARGRATPHIRPPLTEPGLPEDGPQLEQSRA